MNDFFSLFLLSAHAMESCKMQERLKKEHVWKKTMQEEGDSAVFDSL